MKFIELGHNALLKGVTIAYIGSVIISIYGKYTAVSQGFAGAAWYIQLLILLAAVVFTDALFHYCFFTGYLQWQRGEQKQIAIIAIVFAGLGLGLDFAFCHYAGSSKGNEAYEAAMQQAPPLPVSKTATATPHTTTAVLPTISPPMVNVPSNLQALAASGNQWAKSSIAKMHQRAAATQQATQLRALRMTTDAQTQVAKADAKRAEADAKLFDATAKERERAQVRALTKEGLVNGIWRVLSLLSSALQLLSAVAISRFAVNKGLHLHPNFTSITIDVFKMAGAAAANDYTKPSIAAGTTMTAIQKKDGSSVTIDQAKKLFNIYLTRALAKGATEATRVNNLQQVAYIKSELVKFDRYPTIDTFTSTRDGYTFSVIWSAQQASVKDLPSEIITGVPSKTLQSLYA